MSLDLGAHNQRVASAVFRAGLVDEVTLRTLLAERPAVDLAQRLVQLGRVRPDAVARLLGASGSVGPPSGRFGAVGDATLPVPHRPQPVAGQAPGANGPPHVGSSGAPHVGAPHVGVDDRTVLAPPRLPPPPGVDDPTVLAVPTGSGGTSGRGGRPGGSGSGSASELGSTIGGGPGSRSGSSSSFGAAGASGDAGPLTRALQQPPGTELGGLVFGPYRLNKLLAKGGMGAVFVAQHASLGRTVALKVMLQGESASPDDLARFLREARASAKVSHPNVVPVYEIGEVGPVAYLTMELVEGPSLRQLIRAEGALPPRRAMVLVEQVARGVAEAHAQQLIHRDLKPHNVLVAKGDVAKVMDFGLAKETGAEAQQGLTVSGAILGTPSYMAPEQAAGEVVGPPADIYGVGAILYECLTGRAPFEGPTLANIITQVLNKDVVAPRALQPKIHRDVETICLKALEKRPEARYPTAEALADDIARWLAGEAISARPIGLGERLARKARRLGRAGLLAAALSLVLAGGAGWWILTEPARLRALQEQRERELAQRRDEAEAKALAERQAKARAFEARIAAARAELEARAEAARADEDVAEVRAAAEARATAQAAEAPEASVAALVSGPRAVDPARLEAQAWLAVARAEREAAPPGVPCQPASRAAAMAYAAAPTDPLGIEGLARLLEERMDEEGQKTLDVLLQQEVPPGVASRLWSLRVGHHVRAGRLAEAAAAAVEAAARLETTGVPVDPLLRQLVGALGSYRRVLDVPDLPPTVAVPVPGKGGAPGRLLVGGPGGSVDVVTLPAPGRPATSCRVERRAPPLPGKPALTCCALTLVGDQVLSAWFLLDTQEVVVRLDEQVIPAEDGAPIRRQSQALATAFEWVELDGQPATRELVVGVRPNSGDSALLIVEPSRLRLRVEELDLPGRRREASSGMTYVSAACGAPAGSAGPSWVALAYGAWGGQDLRLLGQGGALAGTSGRIGTCWSLHPLDLDGDGRVELLAGHVMGEERGPGFAAPGLAAYAVEPRGTGLSARRLWTFEGVLAPDASMGHGATQVLGFRTRAGAFAFADWVDRDHSRRWLVGVSSTRAAQLVNGRVGASGWSLLSAGDLDGDGDDELLQSVGSLRILGLAGASSVPAPRSGALSVQGASPARQAVERLKDLGQPEALLLAARTVERLEGRTSEELERTQLDALAALTDEGAREREVDRFVADDRRAPTVRYQAIARRALQRLDSPDERVRARGAADLDDPLLLGAQVEGRAELAAAKRMLRLRSGKTGTALTVDFARPVEAETEPLARLLVTNPHRLRVEPRRGLVATVCRRVRFHGGVPLHLPKGAIRLVLRLSTEGECWRGHALVGLFREVEASGGAAPIAEGLAVDASVFQTGQRRALTHSLSPCLGTEALYDERKVPVVCQVAWPLLSRRRLEVTLEHDPATGRGRIEVVDRDRQRVLLSQAGQWPEASFSGHCLLGIYAPGERGHDTAGVNTAPDAEIVLESATVDVLAKELRDGAVAAQPREGRAALDDVYGDVALGRPLVAAELRGRLLRAARDRPRSGARAALVLAGAAPRREGAEAILAALADDPMAMLHAVEDDARLLGAAATGALRDALATAAAAKETKPAARAVALVLRDERDEAYTLASSLTSATSDLSQGELLYLRLAARLEARLLEELEPLLAAHLPFPEHAHHLPALWGPTDELAPAALDALLRSRVEGARDGREQLRWLERWIALRPERADLRRARIDLYSRLQDASLVFAQWLADLRWLVEREPRDKKTRLQLAWFLCSNLDYEAAGRVLRAAPAFTNEELTRALAQPLASPDKDVDLAPFVEAVTGHDAAWRAFVLGLGQPR